MKKWGEISFFFLSNFFMDPFFIKLSSSPNPEPILVCTKLQSRDKSLKSGSEVRELECFCYSYLELKFLGKNEAVTCYLSVLAVVMNLQVTGCSSTVFHLVPLFNIENCYFCSFSVLSSRTPKQLESNRNLQHERSKLCTDIHQQHWANIQLLPRLQEIIKVCIVGE